MNIKKLFRCGWRYLTNADYRFVIDSSYGRYNAMPDEAYLKRKFQATMGRPLDLEAPKTMNEKLQWLKLYDRRPEYTMMADKYLVRNYIAEKLGEEYLIPLLGVWDDPEKIDFDVLPDKFVLKCNHNSGTGMCICKDKEKLDLQKVKAGLRKGLKEDYYLTGREWVYKDIPRRIIAEKYMCDDPNKDEFTDYKFYCFNGYVDCVLVCSERSTGSPKFYFFDRDWNLKRYNKRGLAAPADFTMPKPENMDKMFDIAQRLSADVGAPFLRVDLYNSDGQIYFGELTFFPDCGFDVNRLPETDRYFGDLIRLENRKGE